MFSKACEYAIKSMVFIAVSSKNGGRSGLIEIAVGIESPVSFTAKILQKLVKTGLLESLKGPTGGFSVSQLRCSEIKLSDIVKAIDGDSIMNGCALGFSECNDLKPCAIHNKYKVVREGLKEMLEQTSLLNLTEEIDQGLSFLRRE